MSFFPGKDPAAGDKYACDALETVVVPRSVDLDGFSVRRALPHAQRRTVGPFVFFDHFGPAEFKSGQGIDVRPHPHIGLSTLTYLYDGEIIHRDNLGVKAPIHPGEVNWMTAGRGIVHSERTAPDHRREGEPLHGLQFWVGMPAQKEEIEPSFAHLEGKDLPIVTGEGKTVRVVAGALFGARSPLATTSETLFADVSLDAGAALPLDAETEERGVYIVAGEIVLDPQLSQPAGLKGERDYGLTTRELEILQLIVDGKSNKEIATQLKLSANTVAVHRANMMDALGIHKTAELVVYAIRNGLVNLP